MANIVVAGCSWSSTDIVSGDPKPNYWQRAYRCDLSITNRLRTLGHTVHEIAKPGASVLEQLDHLRKFYRHEENDQHVDYVVFGWTEWTRDTSLQKHKHGEHYPCLGLPYHRAFKRVRKKTIKEFAQFTTEFPNVRFLHWGGLAPVWIDFPDISTCHTLLYRDYTFEEYDILPNHNQLFTFKAVDKKSWVNHVFPGTEPVIRKMILKNNGLRYRSIHASGLLTDMGHLDFEHYTLLVDEIHTHIQGTRSRSTQTCPPFTFFGWPQESDDEEGEQ